MNFSNLTLNELVNTVFDSDNELAKAVIEKIESETSYNVLEVVKRSETNDSDIDDLITFFADDIELKINEWCENYYESAESDYSNDVVSTLFSEGFHVWDFDDFIQREAANLPLDALTSLAAMDKADKEQLVSDLCLFEGYNVEVKHMLSSCVELTLTSYEVGEQEIELKPYIDPLPYCVQDQVKNKLSDNGYYYWNSDSVIVVSLCLEWLQEWLNDNGHLKAA